MGAAAPKKKKVKLEENICGLQKMHRISQRRQCSSTRLNGVITHTTVILTLILPRSRTGTV